MATGLPIVSAHVVEHDASNVLEGHPLWTGAVGIDAEKLTESFVQAAHMAVETSDEVHAEAMAHADRFTREALMSVAVKNLIDDHTALQAARLEAAADASVRIGSPTVAEGSTL